MEILDQSAEAPAGLISHDINLEVDDHSDIVMEVCCDIYISCENCLISSTDIENV